MKRYLKTSKNKRGNYIYSSVDGSKTVLTPGENGVTEEDIALLHSFNDTEVDQNRRETEKHLRLGELTDKEEIIIDEDSNVEELILTLMEEEEIQKVIEEAVSHLKPRDQQIIKWLYLSPTPLTQAQVAKNLGIHEESVKKSVYRIRKKLKEILKKNFRKNM